MLKEEDYDSIFPEDDIDAMQRTSQRLGLVCGKMGLTASEKGVLFFEPEETKAVHNALKKQMVRGSNIYSRKSSSDHEL
jgi:hypothetical protein